MYKAVVVEPLQPMQDPKCFSLYIAVPLLSAREAPAGKTDGPEYYIV